MNLLPVEIYDIILTNFHNYNPIHLYKLRIINRNFRDSIDNVDYVTIKPYKFEDIFNKLAYTGMVKTFKWLFNNKLIININNINNIIIHNRDDVFDLILSYDYLINTIFNRMNYHNENVNSFDIISLSKSNNPLMVCGMNYDKKNSKLNIIKELLNCKIKNNPYIYQLPGLFEICIKYNNIVIIKYLITNYYDKIDHLIYKIYNLNKVEDILYYLIESNKIKIDELLLINLIKKKYNEIFIYCLNKTNIVDYSKIIYTISRYKNIDLYDYINNITDINHNDIITVLSNNIVDDKNKYFIENMINNNLDNIDINKPLINLCLANKLNNDIIINLIKKNYLIEITDIELALKNRNIVLVEHLSNKYNII